MPPKKDQQQSSSESNSLRCELCSCSYPCGDKELSLLQKTSPIISGQKQLIPVSKLCPKCRERRRLAFRDARTLYRRKCDASGREILSIYSEDKPFPVFHTSEWWGDEWDPLDYGREISFDRSFFVQFRELEAAVPHPALAVVGCENSEYNNHLFYSKNCYLCFWSDDCEDCCYVTGSKKMRDCFDVGWSANMEQCYEVYGSENLYECFYCDYCADSSYLMFCDNCANCKHCFGCTNLDYQEYCLFNEPVGKSQYEEFLAKLDLSSEEKIDRVKARVQKFFATVPKRTVRADSSDDCTGDVIFNSRDCQNCFTIDKCESCINVYESARNSRCLDLTFGYDCTGGVYDGVNVVSCFQSAFLRNSFSCSSSYYLTDCHNLSECFGCVGLRNRSNCILNKQYSKADYDALLPRIIRALEVRGEWGEFFPLKDAPLEYSESYAAIEYPEGGQDPYPDRPFKHQKLELEFLKEHGLPLPSKHPDRRYLEMGAKRNARVLRSATCSNAQCGCEMLTTFAEGVPNLLCGDCFREYRFA